GSSLQCYNCMKKLSNSDCMMKETCKSEEQACKTDVIRIVGVLNVINKGCDSSCRPSYQDFKLGNWNISCCSTDFCNVNTASSARYSYGMAAGIAASMLWPFLNNR
ncbi:Prostate stem cell antigen, partial [Pterocles gutturalis]